MPKVIFKFDKEKDLWNNWHKCNWKSSWSEFNLHPQLKKICEGKKLKDCKEKLSVHLSKLHESYLVSLSVEALEKAWKPIEKEFFKRMNKLMKHKYQKNITAYLTTLGICPYDTKEPSFMFSFFYPLPKSLGTCGHEIMHLYFHEFYWDKIEKELGKDKTGDLKEALTVLLNLEFKDLWFLKDEGYKPHEELREFITKQWKKKSDIEILLKECIKWIKKHPNLAESS